MTIEEIWEMAIEKHNRVYGEKHCDPRYIKSCHEMPNIILSLNQERR